MHVNVQKWGNSLALRIPKPFVIETHIKQGSKVNITLKEGGIVITPLSGKKYSLDKLLSKITPDNLHREIDTGEAVGHEIW